MSRFPGGIGRLARMAGHPMTLVRTARSGAAHAAFRLSRRAPLAVRRVIYGPVAAVAGSALRRRGDHPLAAVVRMVALHEVGRGTEAFAEATHARPDASPRTRLGMARVALAFERPDVADRLLAEIPDTSIRGGALGLSGRVELRMGRYRAALARFDQAAGTGPDRAVWRTKAAQVRGELALLDPAWRPDLPAVGAVPVERRERGRVLHLLSNSLPHRLVGYTVRAQSVARCQAAVGLDPRMVTRAGFPGNAGIHGAPAHDEVHGVRYERVSPDFDPDAPPDAMADETARGVARMIEDWRPALLQATTNYKNGQIVRALAETFDIPYVYEVRGFLEETWRSGMGEAATDADRYVLAKVVETDCMRRAAGIVTLSETMRTDILGRGGLDPDRVVVIPNAVDVERFVAGPRDLALAAELGIDPDEPVVGYISSFNAYEGIGYLIEAVARLRRDGRRVRLLLVGDGGDRPRLEAIAAAEGLSADGGVIFTGRVPHDAIERYYRTIDIFVVPRTNDRVSQLVTPLKPYEAMAMEKALLVSAVPALLEIVADGETGHAFTPEDPDALATALAALLDDPAEWRRLGAAARAWITANRTWEQNGRRYMELYQRLGVA